MRCLIVSQSDTRGGAARATLRLHQALLGAGIDSEMLVNHKGSAVPGVIGPTSKISETWNLGRHFIGDRVAALLGKAESGPRSLAILPSRTRHRIDARKPDLTNLHWVNGEMVSVRELGQLIRGGPIVWTLHDMWLFSGADHVSTDLRWMSGYSGVHKRSEGLGVDWNASVWRRKARHWKRPVQLVTPSAWLARCASQSRLTGSWPIRVIPNAVDTRFWRPIEKKVSREYMRLPTGVPLVAFGSFGANDASHKGGDLLREALSHLESLSPEIEVVIVGDARPSSEGFGKRRVHFVGHLHDDVSLLCFYNAVDAVVVPSRIDNFPNMAVEAHACGLPVVAFDVCGLADIVVHKQTGYLARPFDTFDLAAGISWVIGELSVGRDFQSSARGRAEALWSSDVVAKMYIDLFQSVLSGSH